MEFLFTTLTLILLSLIALVVINILKNCKKKAVFKRSLLLGSANFKGLNKNKNNWSIFFSSLQTIASVVAIILAVYAIYSNERSADVTKDQLNNQLKQINQQITVLENISGTSGNLKTNLDSIRTNMDSIGNKFSQIPYEIDEVSGSLSQLNRTALQQFQIYKDQFDLQVLPILEVKLNERRIPGEYFKSNYSLDFINKGVNTIYDIKIEKRLRIYNDIENRFGGTTYKDFWKEVKLINALEKEEIQIPQEDIDELINLRNFSGNSERVDHLIPVLWYRISFKRGIDKKEFSIIKYIMIYIETGKSGNYWLEDVDNDRWAPNIDWKIKFKNRDNEY